MIGLLTTNSKPFISPINWRKGFILISIIGILGLVSASPLPETGVGLSTNKTQDIDFAFRAKDGDSGSAGFVDNEGNEYGLSNNPTDADSLGGFGNFDNDSAIELAVRAGDNTVLAVDSNGEVNPTSVASFGAIGPIYDWDEDNQNEIITAKGGSNTLISVDITNETYQPGIEVNDDSGGIGGLYDWNNDSNLELAVTDTDDKLKIVNRTGVVENLEPDAQGVGGFGDADKDGNIELAFKLEHSSAEKSGNLSFIDKNGEMQITNQLPSKNVGGMADWDKDGDLEVLFREFDCGCLKYTDYYGNSSTIGVDAFEKVGGVADWDEDGEEKDNNSSNNQVDNITVNTTYQDRDYLFFGDDRDFGLGFNPDKSRLEFVNSGEKSFLEFGDSKVSLNTVLDLSGNSITNIGGLQDCGPDEFVNGNGNCVKDSIGSKTDELQSLDEVNGSAPVSSTEHRIEINNGTDAVIRDYFEADTTQIGSLKQVLTAGNLANQSINMMNNDILSGNLTVFDSSESEVPRETIDDQRITTKVSNSYTTSNEESVFVDTSSSGVTVTLASEDARKGNVIRVKDSGLNACQNAVTVDTEGSETIDGSDSIVLDVDGESVELEWNGDEWSIMDKYSPSASLLC